jgi:LysM repeat protein
LAYKICPICGTSAHPNATICATCGTSLAEIQAINEPPRRGGEKPAYEGQFGETDLLESQLQSRREPLLWAGLLLFVSLICVALIAVPLAIFAGLSPETPLTPTVFAGEISSSGVPNPESQPILLATNTQRTTVLLPTVTPAPPTATLTETAGPCEVVVQPGDDLVSLAYQCGHRSQDVLPLIVEMNSLESADVLQAGQTLLIPLPTATLDPLVTPPASVTSSADTGSAMEVAAADNTDAEPPTRTAFPTATLLPGVQWHVVQPNDSMIAIAFEYATTAEVLSMLNPELPFSQCDFQFDTGGPACSVLLQAGQQLRVPAPSPTPTLSPTLSGSETATPTPTATYNAPSVLSPNDRAVFGKDEIITLRWVTTGVLAPGETYRIDLLDTTGNVAYSATTSELFFIVPSEWQGGDSRRHEYQWTISVINEASPDELRYTTPPRYFSWAARGETS